MLSWNFAVVLVEIISDTAYRVRCTLCLLLSPLLPFLFRWQWPGRLWWFRIDLPIFLIFRIIK
jgi:hypothetical protein